MKDPNIFNPKRPAERLICRETNRETDGKPDKQADRQINRQTGIHLWDTKLKLKVDNLNFGQMAQMSHFRLYFFQ